MKKLLFISLILIFSFSCKKAEVRKGIEGEWIYNGYDCSCGNPSQFSGGGTTIYNFGECSRKENKEGVCILTVNDTIEYTYQIINKGTELTYRNATYSIYLDGDNLDLIRGYGGKGYDKYTFIRK